MPNLRLRRGLRPRAKVSTAGSDAPFEAQGKLYGAGELLDAGPALTIDSTRVKGRRRPSGCRGGISWNRSCARKSNAGSGGVQLYPLPEPAPQSIEAERAQLRYQKQKASDQQPTIPAISNPEKRTRTRVATQTLTGWARLWRASGAFLAVRGRSFVFRREFREDVGVPCHT
jgi:hypothetical protein